MNCNDYVLMPFISIVKNIMGIIQIVVPIMLIVWTIYELFQMMKNPDEKKSVKSIKNKFIAAIVIFFIPLLINVSFNLAGSNFNFSNCWNSASSYVFTPTTYKDVYEGKKRNKTTLPNGNKYEKGEGVIKGACLNKSKTTKVLFVGNSKTYVGNIPSKFAGIAKANGYSVSVSSVTEGGKTLYYLGNNYSSKISSASYDCVVLQEQTDVYAGDYGTYLAGAQKVVSLVKSRNKNVKTYIRALWITRESGSGSRSTSYGYAEKVASNTSSGVIYDGKAFDRSRNTYPNINLFGDSIHQNDNGAYLSAATIYKVLSGKAATSASYTGGLSQDTATKLLKIAAQN